MAGLFRAALAAMLLGLVVPALAPGQEAPPEAGPAPGATVDSAARLFLGRCAGCHTVGGGNLSGPDLLPSTRWPRAELWAGVKRMEAKAGPMKDAQVDELTDLLRSGQARERVQAQQQALAAASAVTLSAPSPAEGEALFHGWRRLSAGGPSCVSCHAVGGIGGSLGLDLSTVGARLGQMALRSAIEQSSYPVMRPIYAARPITPQEAAHLAAYLEKAAGTGGRRSEPPVALLGLVAAGGVLGLLAVYGRQRAAGTRRRLVQKAQER